MTQILRWWVVGPAALLAVGAIAVVILAGRRSTHRRDAASLSVAQVEAYDRAARARNVARHRPPIQQQRRSAASTQPSSTEALQPPIIPMFLPFPETRKREMAAYAERHYGIASYQLQDPKAIVEHYTVTSDARSTYNVFAPDVPDSGLHELPNTCAHFVVDRDGTIYQLVPLGIMCRHTIGLNYAAIGIENVGFSDQQILANPVQLRASVALTRWLRCRYSIPVEDVIGHNESLSSPYHHELVPSLRRQTHEDWKKADMDIYRARLRALPC